MAALGDITASLNVLEIPAKLRCAACNKLATNAFRIECCDQSICEDCQASLPQACPICLHEPVTPDKCRVNKALRTTIKVWLRKKSMEIEAAKKKDMVDKIAAATPSTTLPIETRSAQPAQATTQSGLSTNSQGIDSKDEKTLSESQAIKSADEGDPALTEPEPAQQDVPQMSIESPGPQGTPRRASTQTIGDNSVGHEKTDEKDQALNQNQLQNQNAQWAMSNGLGMGINGAGFGLEGMNGGLSNMGFNGMGDTNQMMQFMQSGIPNNMMGMVPNMMGMPGMGIDPMAMSQGMYGGFGGPGMGMNGMNMGMGFDAGQGAYSGFNGQSTAWNAGQNKIYQNAHGGHANGMGVNDFGANAAYSGYNMPQHQGNFNQMHHHQYPNNDFQHGYHNQGFQGRGRGRGRGGYYNAGRGRGGYAQVAQGNHTNHENFHQQVPQGPVRRGSPQYTPMAGHQNGENPQEGKIEDAASKQAAEDQLNKDLAPGDANDQDEKALVTQTEEAEAKTFVEADETNAVPLETKSSEQPEADVAEAAVNLPAEDFKPAPIETFISDDLPKSEAPVPEEIVSVPSAMLPPPSPVIPTGPSHSMEISPRGRGRGFHTRGFTTYRGGPQGRGSEFLPNGSINPVDKSAVPPIAPKGLGVEGAPKGPKALRQGLPNASVRENLGMSIVGRASAAAQSRANGDSKMKSPPPAPSRSRSRSPSRHHSSNTRHHRLRSTSPSGEQDKTSERHKHHSRRYDDKREDRTREHRSNRTRADSADSSIKRSSHRTRRDSNDREKKDKDSTRSSHRSHRTHRERSREAESHRSKKRSRSRSPEQEFHINGASRMNTAKIAKIDSTPKEEEYTISSRKRRDRDDNDSHRERKRSKREEEIVEEVEASRSKHTRREEKDSRSNHDRAPKGPEKSAEKAKSPPRGPKIDQHALEREARNRERQMKELQRRAVMEGKGPGKGGDSRVGGRGTGGLAPGSRRVSVKYEDDESIRRVENEREAGRWG